MRPKSRDGFEYAITCSLPLEMDAVEALLDECYDRFGTLYDKCPGDTNIYTCGRIGPHNVVLCLTADIGKAGAAATVPTLLLSYPNVRLVFVVGVCGGVPFPSVGGRGIFLGDVLISDSIIEYDVGVLYTSSFQRQTDIKSTLGRPNRGIRSLLSNLGSDKGRKEFKEQTEGYVTTLQSLQKDRWERPDVASDVLFESSYQHRHRQGVHLDECICLKYASEAAVCKVAMNASCLNLGCEEEHIRRRRPETEGSEWAVHIGTFACAETVMKSGIHRDDLAEKEGVIGFEMEGAGVWDLSPCLIIKSVCDYADSHKSQAWQKYAAAAAASGAKAILEHWLPTTKPVPQTASSGQVDELKKMKQNFQHLVKERKDVVLWGHQGSGKPQLTIHYTTIPRKSYDSIIWIDSSLRHSILESFARVCSNLKGHLERGQSVIKSVLENDTNHSWILVFDNVESRDKAPESDSINPRPYFPNSYHDYILLTSTSSDVPHRLNFASIHIRALNERAHPGPPRVQQTLCLISRVLLSPSPRCQAFVIYQQSQCRPERLLAKWVDSLFIGNRQMLWPTHSPVKMGECNDKTKYDLIGVMKSPFRATIESADALFWVLFAIHKSRK
ncbi:Pfs and NB-ARC domain protein [Aspergillus clavatus NRRL 1]|uniref:Pfs and NB-ARC domain protein n=1 Tax=Aspergillus clavatus (strain ATCC 1007 / CBS 513.65 / DSM 816 / NCTC 3887 / NRRL 1 / QM 1276 / 107) TaxID=344612 RepID=A1C870_ASPCL|nr:Pfs and NB-ARC domain protein [Aspergillus clavatus NRRL 1]EAW14591.1 Pfs and NB-ARC domain protein [Aspergillus clavatus NRRL 1]